MADDEGQRKLAAILVADVAGYSRLMADDERATVRRKLTKTLRPTTCSPGRAGASRVIERDPLSRGARSRLATAARCSPRAPAGAFRFHIVTSASWPLPARPSSTTKTSPSD